MNAHLRSRIRRECSLPEERANGREKTLLAVSDCFSDPTIMAPWANMNGTVGVTFQDLTVEIVRGIDPDVVLTSLISPNFDCTDVAQTLMQSEFTGELRVVCEKLPRPELVSEELQKTFPGLDIDLWMIPRR